MSAAPLASRLPASGQDHPFELNLNAQQQDVTQPSTPIQQISLFNKLPSELVLDIFDHLDIVTIFRFLDTCRYHRYLLLNLPEVWRRVRFIPLSEYTIMSSSRASVTPLSLAAVGSNTSLSASTPGSINGTFAKAQHKRPPQHRRRRSRAGASSSSGSNSDDDGEHDDDSASKQEEASGSTEADAAAAAAAAAAARASRLKHAENERDRERGGSRTLISEIYAVLRRFRKDNRLIDFVREIDMDSTDSPHFPSPLVMLIKFPMLEVLSSRYRRKQTSLITDTHTLKDMLRNGDILPHSLRLRHWNVFHPYMVEEDVAGFKQILDAITVIGLEASDSKDGSGHSESASKKRSGGVTLDIRLCRGHVQEHLATTTAALPTTASHGGGGMHWAAPSGRSATGPQAGSVALTTGSTTPSVSSTTTLPPQLCNNIVWVLEKCRVCNAHQDQCWKCVWQCKTCGSARAPPYINHQTALERERFRHTPATTLQIPSATAPASGVDLESVPVTGNAYSAEICRPVTPPGSISLSRMSNPSVGIRSAYIATHQSARHELLLSSAIASGSASPSPQVVGATLSRPPEFSFFD